MYNSHMSIVQVSHVPPIKLGTFVIDQIVNSKQRQFRVQLVCEALEEGHIGIMLVSDVANNPVQYLASLDTTKFSRHIKRVRRI